MKYFHKYILDEISLVIYLMIVFNSWGITMFIDKKPTRFQMNTHTFSSVLFSLAWTERHAYLLKKILWDDVQNVNPKS